MSQSAMPDEHIPGVPEPPPGAGPDHSTGAQPYLSRRRQLRRSKQNRVIGGVCGGLGCYVDADPVLFRVAFIALLIPGGAGILFYILAWIIIPEFKSELEETRDSSSRPLDRRTAATAVGSLLIIIGSLILIERFIDWFDPRVIGGSALILIGVFVFWRGLKQGD